LANPLSPNSSNCFAIPISYVISPHLIGLLTLQFVDADLLIDVDDLVHGLVNAQVFILEIWGQTADLKRKKSRKAWFIGH
jgi:hypothetical protein